MKLFQHKRITEIKTEDWQAAARRIQLAIELEQEKINDGLLDPYPIERAHAEGMIEAYENALDTIEQRMQNNVPRLT